jgi:hypothetical protein
LSYELPQDGRRFQNMSRENSLPLHLRLKYSRDPSTPRPSLFRIKRFFWRFGSGRQSPCAVFLAVSLER